MKVFLRIPTAAGVDRELTRWLMWFAREMPDADIDIHCSCWGVVENRNQICQQFLQSDCTHLWMVDADTVPPKNLNLLDHADEFPCLNGIYQHLTMEGLVWDTWFRMPDKTYAPIPQRRWPTERLFNVDAVGCGCMVLQKELVEAIQEPRFEMRDGKGEDFHFCERVAEAGYKVMVDRDYRCDHQKDVSLRLLSRITKGI